ncbi:MAG: hypothetical protein ACK5HT_03130 [Draconibacterium sp.]
MGKSNNQENEVSGNGTITRKEAIKKVGVSALAASSLLLLDTKAKACASGHHGGNNHHGGGHHGGGHHGGRGGKKGRRGGKKGGRGGKGGGN